MTRKWLAATAALLMLGETQADAGDVSISINNSHDVSVAVNVGRAEASTERPRAIGCEEEYNLRSLPTAQATAITFWNGGREIRKVYWLNHTGRRVLYGVLASSQNLRLTTYVTHPWVIADEDDTCLDIYLPTATALQIQLH